MPPSALFRAGEDLSCLAERTAGLTWPLFVKPARAGSSFGITKVDSPEALPAAVAAALEHDSKVVIEEAIPGFEVGCAVLGNEELTVGLVDEIELSGGFFNFTEKYNLVTSAIHVPARISPRRRRRSRRRRKPSTGPWSAGALPGWICSSPPTGGSCSTRSTPSPASPPTAATPV